MRSAPLITALGLTVLAACSGGGGGTADRTVALQARDYAYSGLETFSGTAGETVRFAMTNNGSADHEFEVFGPDGKAIGEIGPTSAGATKKVTLSLKKAGTYRFRCDVSDHESRGMHGTFEVK
jgi:uncharacterized cupredoxin-like copper-binding protein